MKIFLEENLPAIITGILGLSAWIFEKRKKNAEIQEVESNALSSMQQAYDKFVADSNRKFDEMKAELELSRKEVAQSRIEVQELKAEIEEWQAKYERVLKELKAIQDQ